MPYGSYVYGQVEYGAEAPSGGLVTVISDAKMSLGWRGQTQRDSAARAGWATRTSRDIVIPLDWAARTARNGKTSSD